MKRVWDETGCGTHKKKNRLQEFAVTKNVISAIIHCKRAYNVIRVTNVMHSIRFSTKHNILLGPQISLKNNKQKKKQKSP